MIVKGQVSHVCKKQRREAKPNGKTAARDAEALRPPSQVIMMGHERGLKNLALSLS